VTSQEAQNRELTSLIIGPLSEDGEQVTGSLQGALQSVQVMRVVNQSLLIFDVFILREIQDFKVELRNQLGLRLRLGVGLGWFVPFNGRKSWCLLLWCLEKKAIED
jgi:hypothetical protein